MEKLLHSIQLNVFESSVEKLPEIHTVFHYLLPLDFEKNHLKIDHQQLQGFSGIIHSLTLQTISNRHNSMLLDAIFSHLSRQEVSLMELQKESRLNQDGVFYIRLDKQSLLQNIFRLTDSGDCFHIKIKLAAYPATKDRYFQNLRKILEPYL
ncbi:MAG: RNA-binding domain-containing protein [Candidatus Thermoplasmatota archaeon]|nr:RNA-binding domain-containing protein [Candidatus Thermoplasmatota archaeon]